MSKRRKKESNMEEQKLCIKTFNITEEQSEFIKNGSELLRVSQSEILRSILDEAMNPKKENENDLAGVC